MIAKIAVRAPFTAGPWWCGPTPGYLDGNQSQHPGMGPSITIRSPAHTEEIATVWTYLLPTEANASLIAAAPDMHALLGQAWGALNFILAFYEPGQRYLDTEAWKNAEASGRRVHAALRAKLDELPPAPKSADVPQ